MSRPAVVERSLRWGVLAAERVSRAGGGEGTACLFV